MFSSFFPFRYSSMAQIAPFLECITLAPRYHFMFIFNSLRLDLTLVIFWLQLYSVWLCNGMALRIFVIVIAIRCFLNIYLLLYSLNDRLCVIDFEPVFSVPFGIIDLNCGFSTRASLRLHIRNAHIVDYGIRSFKYWCCCCWWCWCLSIFNHFVSNGVRKSVFSSFFFLHFSQAWFRIDCPFCISVCVLVFWLFLRFISIYCVS